MKNHKHQLRIGNILHHIALGTCKVLGIHNDGSIHIGDIRDNEKQHLVLSKFTHRLEEVILTPEIHNKFGIEINGFLNFEYPLDEETKLVFGSGYVFIRQKNKRERKQIDDLILIWNKDIKRRDMYVHELQNLYFSLTGRELVFNEA